MADLEHNISWFGAAFHGRYRKERLLMSVDNICHEVKSMYRFKGNLVVHNISVLAPTGMVLISH